MHRRFWYTLIFLALISTAGAPLPPVIFGHDARNQPAEAAAIGAGDTPTAAARAEPPLWPMAAWTRLTTVEPQWRTWESGQFRLHVLPGSAAARDVHHIAAEARASLERMSARLGITFDKSIELYLVERVFWQGGAAYGAFRILITYSDRNYVDIPLSAYLDHELVHALAQTLHVEDGSRNSLMAEGLAVWAVGGHYGPEPVDEMAAALPAMQRYIPLQRLLDDFHAEQHEIAYIEAGSFVGFLIERYGLETVKRFYGNADRPADYFDGKGYGELEQEWLAWLAEHARTPRRFEWGRYADTDWLRLASATGRTPFSTQAGGGVLMPPAFDERWWQLQIRYFDAMRAYQQRFEPFARTLPAAPSDWATPLRSEYAINPAAPENLALETQLQAASQGLYCNDLDSAAARLTEVEESAAAGRLTGAEARQRLAVTRLLASQDQALRASNGAAYVATAAASLRPHLEELLRQVDERGGAHQELSRLWLNALADRATAWVTWLPLPEQGGAIPISATSYRLVLTREGRQWLLTDIQPLQLTKLLPRSDHLCNPSLAASW